MFFLDIDIAKHNHVASLNNGNSIFKAYSFYNSSNETDSLIDKLKNILQRMK